MTRPALRGCRSTDRLRRWVLHAIAFVAGVVASLGGTASGSAQTPQAGASQASSFKPCRNVEHESASFTVCEVDLRRHAVRLFWRRPDGQAYGYLGALPQTLPQAPTASADSPSAAPPRGLPATSAASRGRLLFAMNGGMFHPDYKPVGLYVEGGREVTRVNTRNGPGNFHLKPNGIFFMTASGAGVLDTTAYLKARPPAEFATQSGPMLVINGRLHPRFSKEGESQKARNGVGVRDANTIVFAISEGEVSFGLFARLFRDTLKTPNALFLDGGSAPALYGPSLSRSGNFLPLGPMIAVFEKGR